MNASDIETNEPALAAALAGDWSACAAAMQSVVITAEPRLCFSVETSMAIIAVGGNPNEIMAAMDQDATGRFLLNKLATVGLMWAHPLTVAYLDAAVAANGLGQTSRDAAVNLSAPKTTPFANVTATDCQTVWEAAMLQRDWATALNEAINPATNDRTALVAALRSVADALEAG